jgi:hypothetical protein
LAINYIGLLAELAIFRRPISADEVQELHRQPRALR